MNPIAQKLQAVHERIRAACNAAGRPEDAVRLLAVSKTFPAEDVRAAHAAGQTAFGENYIQEGVDKIAALREVGLQWHCIGPIQSNKTRLVAEHFDWVHSVDRLKIAQRLSAQRPQGLAPLHVCLQVNTDGGPSKSGVRPEEVLDLARAVMGLPRLVLRGLMTIPDPVHGFEQELALHRRATAVFERVRAELAPPQWDTLSMGMTADLEAAIHAGSTLVRVGTAIFGGRTAATPS
ncbi:MAG: YggS family pyridoxal phosphate-dependent enzyme [Betaproteobacteria bacterium]|nr:YggS family pyridoxal phosphate-dependent enzyme [Betaproteobacteria bacterium]